MSFEIDDFLSNEYAIKLKNSQEFYFQKGKDKLQEWLSMTLDDNLKNSIINLSSDYKSFQDKAIEDSSVANILNLLFKIVSYCDVKARDKNTLNEYDDKRALARANVRMNDWIKQLVLYKFDPDSLTDGSVRNAIEYLLEPKNNTTILSINHRRMIARKLFNKEYEKQSFADELKQHFQKYRLKSLNDDNYTEILSFLIYEIKETWFDEIIGLMASDATDWQDEFIINLRNFDSGIFWNSKTPTGTIQTLEPLRDILDEGRSFSLFYSIRGQVIYKANIIDFAQTNDELNNWIGSGSRIYGLKNKIEDYVDGNKFARILFLTDKMEKVDPVDVNNFTFFKSQPPRQDNISPISGEPSNFLIRELLMKETRFKNEKEINHNQPLNQILYGPPGTGKTYNTINHALKILGKDIQELTRAQIKEIFDQMLKEGRIIFTTFHQSMSYEDFIEGIKPKLDDGDGDEHLKYEIKDGIFKILCNRINNIIKLNQNNLKNNKSFNNFSELYDSFVIKLKEILDDLEESDKHYFESRRSKVLLLSVEGNTILTSGEKANTTETIQKEKLERIYNKFNSPEEITNIVKQLREVGTDIGWTTNYYAVFKSLKDFENANKRDDITESSFLNNFVLIIDEINRGNVSQIFGELITLIEEDKRSGMGEELEITLPYSKKSFSVPPNLYIIGTMNTADRSVEALDSALRRRFHFIEMPPEPNLIKTEGKSKDKNGIVDGIDLKDLLTTINNRIEKLLDKDHLIGHSYFMDVAVIEDLMSAFQNKIIPLLQEYFFGDYGKIGLVLGEGFFELSPKNEDDIFAKFGEYDTSTFSDKIIYKQKDLNKMDSNDFKSAITELLGNKSDSE
jgi:5-methylcytosine-specific restriction protein B